MSDSNKIQRQLTLFSFMVALFFGLVIITTLTIYTFNQTKAMQERTLSIAVTAFDSILNDADYSLTKLISSLNDTPLLPEYANASKQDRPALLTKIRQLLSEHRISNRYIDAFCLYIPPLSEIITSYDNLTRLLVKDPGNIKWLQVPVKKDANRSGWTIVTGIISDFNDSGSSYKMMRKAEIPLVVDGKQYMAQLCVCLHQNVLRSSVFSFSMLTGGFMALQDGGNHLLPEPALTLSDQAALRRVLSPIQPPDAGGFLHTFSMFRSYNFISSVRSESTKWPLYIVSPLAGYIRMLLLQAFLPALLSVIPAILLSRGFCRRIYQPISTLRQCMKNVEEGNMTAYAPTGLLNEYGELFAGYNNMLVRINRLVTELSDERALHIDAEIRNLQSQINPHFLYNTLDTIQWMATFGENEKAAKTTRLLASYYRLNLNNGNQMISVENTVKMIKEYFDILRERLGERIAMSIQADESILHAQMLHNVVQPLVENAFKHGLSAMSSRGELQIIFKPGGPDMMEITVYDNGAGIEPAKLESLRTAIAQKTQQDSWAYALHNINQRLIYVYGPECALKIDSTAGNGTCIRVLMRI